MPCINYRIWAFIIPLPKELRELWIHYFLLFIFLRDTKGKREPDCFKNPPSIIRGLPLLPATNATSLSGSKPTLPSFLFKRKKCFWPYLRPIPIPCAGCYVTYFALHVTYYAPPISFFLFSISISSPLLDLSY